MLLANGHPDAGYYPLWQLAMESSIVKDRFRMQAISEAIFTQQAIAALLDNKGQQNWKKLVEDTLSNGKPN